MSGKNDRTQSSVLKTTTWGALIAALIVVSVVGFQSWTNTDANRPAPSFVAKLRLTDKQGLSAKQLPHQSEQSSTLNQTFPVGTALAGAKSPSTADNSLPARNAEQVSAVGLPQASAKENASHTTSGSGADSPALQAAAKISPDLKGIDPEAPVDVIVQYRTSPAGNELVG